MEGMNYNAYNRPAEPSTPSSRPPQVPSGCPYRHDHEFTFAANPHQRYAPVNHSPHRGFFDPVHNPNNSWASAPTSMYPQWPPPMPPYNEQPGMSNFSLPAAIIAAREERQWLPMTHSHYSHFSHEWAENNTPFPPRSEPIHPHQTSAPLAHSLFLPQSNGQHREVTGNPQVTNVARPPVADSQTQVHMATSASQQPRSAPATHGAALESPPSSDLSDSGESSSSDRVNSPPVVNGSHSLGATNPASHVGDVSSAVLPQPARDGRLRTPPGIPNLSSEGSGSVNNRRYMPPRLARGSRSISRFPRDGSDEDFQSSMEEQQMFMDQYYGTSGVGARMAELSEGRIRLQQLIRGGMTCRQVASPAALASLESVEISTLPEGERTCIICYNDFGTDAPEGFNEAPLRLPKCKHIFGDHCIKKWFEESDSCPYCRHKLPSVQVYRTKSGSVFRREHAPDPADADLGTISGGQSARDVLATEMMMRVMTRREDRDELPHVPEGRWQHTHGRRSPPDELGNSHSRRRLRTMQTGYRASQPSYVPGGSVRPNSFSGPSPPSNTSPTQQSPNRDRYGPRPPHQLPWIAPFHTQFGNQRRLGTSFPPQLPSLTQTDGFPNTSGAPSSTIPSIHSYFNAQMYGEGDRPQQLPPMVSGQASAPYNPSGPNMQHPPQFNVQSAGESQPPNLQRPPNLGANHVPPIVRSDAAGASRMDIDNVGPMPQGVPGGEPWHM